MFDVLPATPKLGVEVKRGLQHIFLSKNHRFLSFRRREVTLDPRQDIIPRGNCITIR